MNRRQQMIIAAAVVGIVVIAAAYPLWIPLFVNDVVDEAFPDLTAEQRDEIRAMPQDQQDVLVEMADEDTEMAGETALAMMEDDVEMADDMPEAEPVALLTGTFNEFDPIHRGDGSATIYQLGDGSRILRLEDFSTSNGPDLYVRLIESVPNTIFGMCQGLRGYG